MAYCKAEEVIEMLKEDMLNGIIGEGYIDDPEDREKKMLSLAVQAVEDADAEIDGFLMKRYRVPLLPVPAVISKYSKDIAVYNLVSRQGLDTGERESNYLTRYKNAIAFLTNVAKGLTDVVIEGTTKAQAAKTSFAIQSSQRLFSRDSMRGM